MHLDAQNPGQVLLGAAGGAERPGFWLVERRRGSGDWRRGAMLRRLPEDVQGYRHVHLDVELPAEVMRERLIFCNDKGFASRLMPIMLRRTPRARRAPPS